MGRSGGGIGTNQYRVRGKSTIRIKIPSYGHKIVEETSDTQAARQPGLTKQQWRRYSRSLDSGVRLIIAQRTDCPPEIFARLTKNDADFLARLGALSNPACPSSHLYRWVMWGTKIGENQTVAAVAINPACPHDLLQQLAMHESPIVRATVASSRTSPSELLAQLGDDQNWSVLQALADNESCPLETLSSLAASEHQPVRDTAVNNPNCPDHIRAIAILGQ